MSKNIANLSIKCGDTVYCARCKFFNKMMRVATFTKNMLGRCDYFEEKGKGKEDDERK